MSKPILTVENISKQYALGVIGTGSLRHDLNRWWHKARGKEDPYLSVGEVNDRSTKATSRFVWALKDVSFDVEQGEVLGIIGKNGAGKSTLLKILSRVTTPSTGVVKAHGRVASLLEVGTGFHPELTGRENIYLNGAILGMRRDEITSKLDEIIAFSSCERYIDTPTKRYSSGMRVRLAFAVAAHLEPEILVIDEVLAVGDASFQRKAIAKMKDISSTGGRTVLFVSHSMGSVQSLCNRAILMKHGQIDYMGDTKTTINKYLQVNSKAVGQKLADRTDRIGGNQARFTQIKLMGENGDVQTNVLAGQPYNLDVHLDAHATFDGSVQAIIIDSMGRKRFTCNSYLITGNALRYVPGKDFHVRFHIPKLPLPQGNYTITLLAQNVNDIADEIDAALEFTVIGGDFYGSGQERFDKDGVLVPVDFEKLNWGG